MSSTSFLKDYQKGCVFLIIELTEWAGLILIAAIFARAFLMATNNDNDEIWQKTEEAEVKALRMLGIHGSIER